MKLRKADLRRRVNGDLGFRFEARGLTSLAGLELIRRYFKVLELAPRVRRHLGKTALNTDFGVVSMVLLVLGVLITGGRRVRHMLFHRNDPLLLRFCGLQRMPTPRTVGRWLRRFTHKYVERLLCVNDELVAEGIRRAGLRRLTIDVDGSVVSTGLKVQWAARGFNPHHRKVPSYYPITAYEAQSGQILRVKNRPGNVHDGKASLGFLRSVFRQMDETLGSGYQLEFRMDGAFFRKDVVRMLLNRGAEFAIKVPFFEWTDLKGTIQRRRRWKRVRRDVSCFSQALYCGPWDRTLHVVVYRKHVRHQSRKNYQLDLFDPSTGHFEYSAIATNKSLNGKNLWLFLNGRGSHEKAYSELKNGYAFDSVPTSHYGANSAWQVFSVLAFNLMHSFQVATTAQQRSQNRKRSTIYRLELIQTLRYKWINRAGNLVYPNGQATLDVGDNAEMKNRFIQIDRSLAEAA